LVFFSYRLLMARDTMICDVGQGGRELVGVWVTHVGW
jgi:hypothetical protein